VDLVLEVPLASLSKCNQRNHIGNPDGVYLVKCTYKHRILKLLQAVNLVLLCDSRLSG